MSSETYREERLFIGGEWVKPIDGETAPSYDPATGKVWAHIPHAGVKDVDRAVAAAKEALHGPWKEWPPFERAALLRRIAEIYQKRAPELAELESRDSGRVIREARADVGSHHQWYYWFASLADKLGGRTVPMENHIHAFTSRVPVGVVGAISPWNVPLSTTNWKVGPALAAGCTMVLKPAECTSVTSLELARIIHEAGAPPGVFNVTPGHGRITGQAIVSHPDVNKISLTGEGSTAKDIIRTGAATMKRFSFELGGKAPHIIFEDADIENAINAAVASAFVLCGQSCALGSRVLVQRSIYERVAAEFTKRANAIRVGMPLEESSQMGPQVHEPQMKKSLDYIDIGKEEGARLLAGGSRIVSGAFSEGYFVQPTVFGEVKNEMRIAQEEIFGPVVALVPFETEADAIRMANDSPFGLTAGLWTKDLGRAHRVAAAIDAGTVWVNTYRYVRWSLPYGGFKESGLGRENGLEAVDAYLETKTTVINLKGEFPNPYAS